MNPKKNFVITYVNAEKYIDFATFRDVSGLDIDECHTTSCNAAVYSYLHFKTKVRVNIVENALEKLKNSHGIKRFEVYGYDSVGSTEVSKGDKIEDHIAFQMLVKDMNTKNSKFAPCTDGIAEVSRGLLNKYKACTKQVIEYLGDKRRNKTFLANHVEKMQEQIEELESKLETKEVEIDEVRYQNEKLKRKIDCLNVVIEGYKKLSKYQRGIYDDTPLQP